ncbi:MAG: long-chain-fatty-acid--CoA ligase [Desulfobacteraceae bacterium]|nr:MAG: long-chain-fatty-acid--CoA ligase [Desulfobacteraceae bacterium]
MYTLGDLPRNGANFFPEAIAVVYEGSRYTYREFNNRTNRFSNALIGLGYKKGDRLCVMADNCSKYLEVYFGAAKIGMSVTPINIRLGDQELIYIINHCEATMVIVGDEYEQRVAAIEGELKQIKRWITLDNPIKGYLDYEDLLSNSSETEPDPDVYDVQEDDLAVLMYTGGTTGLPKGVMLSHRNCMLSGITAAVAMEFTRRDSTCYVLPIFHVSWWPILAILYVYGKVCINRRPNLAQVFELIQREKCTHMNLVPTIYGWMVDYPDIDTYDLSSLRICSYAGSPFPTEILKKCMKKFGNKFCQGYGATETAGAAISMLAQEDHFLEGPKSKCLVSAGKPSPCSRVKIVDSDNKSVAPGARGEICAKGKHIMLGYWKSPDATASALIDGWYHTGDIGYMDEEGFIYMTDRKADMIISGGENVYPAEVENVIYQHPSVFECSVVSAPSEKWGEIVQAVVVLKPDRHAAEEEIIAHCKRSLAGYKCPKAVAFWDSIPKTIVGKIIKKDIKAKFWEGKERTIG